jgi:HEAT repeat protein
MACFMGVSGASLAVSQAPQILMTIRYEVASRASESSSSGATGDSNAIVRGLIDAGYRGEIKVLLVNHDRTDTVRSLAAVLRRSDPSRIGDVVAAFNLTSDKETQTSLMQVMGQSGNAKALPILRKGLQDQDAEVKRAAILALTDWPDGAPIPDLMNTARTANNPAHQVLALRGALRLVGLPGTRGTPGENVQVLAEAMSLAKQTEEKRAVLALLIRFPTKEALDLASASVSDSAVTAEAKAAVARLERTVRR